MQSRVDQVKMHLCTEVKYGTYQQQQQRIHFALEIQTREKLDFVKVLRAFAISGLVLSVFARTLRLGGTLRALGFFFFLTEHHLWQV